MASIRLFHATNKLSAALIEQHGFRDNVCGNWPPGVFLSNYPVDVNEGAKGDVVFEVRLESTAEELFYEREIVEQGKPYREFIVPASILNDPSRCMFRRLVGDDETNAEIEGFWNEYPPGQPHAMFAKLDADDSES
ncbi:MAG: hypothetical protein U0939_14835 [Pirellulales bacterium]